MVTTQLGLLGGVFRYKEGSYSAAVRLYSDSIMYDRNDAYNVHNAHDALDTCDAETDKTGDTDTQLEHDTSKNKVMHETEDIVMDQTSSQDKERKPDKDVVQEPHEIKEKVFDVNVTKMRYQTLYSRAMCYSKIEQYNLCIQVLISNMNILAT